jgi:hypothetical protein
MVFEFTSTERRCREYILRGFIESVNQIKQSIIKEGKHD